MATIAKSPKGKASPRKIDAKQAVANSVEYFKEFFPLHAKSNMLLEELEESTDGRRWLVTLGYDGPNPDVRALLGDLVTRHYKLFSVDSATGKVLSVKIRKV